MTKEQPQMHSYCKGHTNIDIYRLWNEEVKKKKRKRKNEKEKKEKEKKDRKKRTKYSQLCLSRIQISQIIA